MTQEQECQDLLMTEVTRIDLVKRSAWTLPVPFQVENIGSMTVSKDYDAAALLLMVDYVGEGDATMKPYPSHSSQEGRDRAGLVRTHSLEIPIDRGFQAIRDKENSIQQEEFNVVLHTYGGTRFLAYALPGSSQLAVADKEGKYGEMSIKVSLKSMSGLIRLDFAENEE